MTIGKRTAAFALAGLFVMSVVAVSFPDIASAQRTPNSGKQSTGKTKAEQWTPNRWGGGNTNAPRPGGGCPHGCYGNLDPYDPVNINAAGNPN
jgi:hypothetical protein